MDILSTLVVCLLWSFVREMTHLFYKIVVLITDSNYMHFIIGNRKVILSQTVKYGAHGMCVCVDKI